DELCKFAQAEARHEPRDRAYTEAGREFTERLAVPFDAVDTPEAMQHLGLNRRNRDGAGHGHGVGSRGCGRIAHNMRMSFIRKTVARLGVRIFQKSYEAGRSCRLKCSQEFWQPIIRRFEAVAGAGEIQRHEKNGPAPRKAAEKRPLISEAAGEV